MDIITQAQNDILSGLVRDGWNFTLFIIDPKDKALAIVGTDHGGEPVEIVINADGSNADQSET